MVPGWLESLLGEKFFNACIYHEEARKNEKNIFCLDCCQSICPHCLTPHGSHRLLQIRRYVYNDVIRLSDAEKLMDCAFVQSYTTNSAKVVFLNQRAQTRACRVSANNCNTCDRSLKDSYLFCSLSCKLQHILRTEGRLSKYIYNGENISLPEPGSDDGLMTPDSVLEQSSSTRTGESGSTESAALACTATTEVSVVRKKRTSRPPPMAITASMMNRRKGSRPQRSPLY